MNEKEITIKELITSLIKKWYWTVIIGALVFAFIFGTNYSMFKNIDKNAYYTWEMDIDIDLATVKDLMEVADEVIRSDEFREKVMDEHGYFFSDDFIDNLVYGQTSSNQDNVAIFKVRILASSKNIMEIQNFFNILSTTGEPLLEKKFKSNVSFDRKQLTRIVAGKGANLNLASNYTEYREMHAPTRSNIIMWIIMSLVIGFAAEMVIVLFSNPFKKNK